MVSVLGRYVWKKERALAEAVAKEERLSFSILTATLQAESVRWSEAEARATAPVRREPLNRFMTTSIAKFSSFRYLGKPEDECLVHVSRLLVKLYHSRSVSLQFDSWPSRNV